LAGTLSERCDRGRILTGGEPVVNEEEKRPEGDGEGKKITYNERRGGGKG